MAQTEYAGLFVTGMPRSGTTLVDKLLSQHPQIQVYSQPLPLLFVETKKQFLRNHYVDDRYRLAVPLGDLLGDRHAERKSFQAFLPDHLIAPQTMAAIIDSQRSYTGCYTPPPSNWRPDRSASTLIDTWSRYCRFLHTAQAPATQAAVLGSKETFCEEYIPYFLSEGSRVVLVIRDPRDAICSANSGDGMQHAGRQRPLLFNIRQWRKSAEFALAYREHPNLIVVRYEQLVQHPATELSTLFSFLEVAHPTRDISKQKIRDLNGEPWQSNSSHQPSEWVSTDSVGRFVDLLPEKELELIQCACFAEMRCLGYDPGVDGHEVEDRLHNLALDEAELVGDRRQLLPYRFTSTQRQAEVKRWRSLRNQEPPEPAQFVFTENFATLSGAAAKSTT